MQPLATLVIMMARMIASVVLIDRNSGFYITEGQEIRGGASLNNYLTALVSYETLS
jgi:hypothetical protein